MKKEFHPLRWINAQHLLCGSQTMVDAVEEMTLDVSRSDQDDSTKSIIEDDKDVTVDGGVDMYAEFSLPHPYTGRPSIGCRKMVQVKYPNSQLTFLL